MVAQFKFWLLLSYWLTTTVRGRVHLKNACALQGGGGVQNVQEGGATVMYFSNGNYLESILNK